MLKIPYTSSNPPCLVCRNFGSSKPHPMESTQAWFAWTSPLKKLLCICMEFEGIFGNFDKGGTSVNKLYNLLGSQTTLIHASKFLLTRLWGQLGWATTPLPVPPWIQEWHQESNWQTLNETVIKTVSVTICCSSTAHVLNKCDLCIKVLLACLWCWLGQASTSWLVPLWTQEWCRESLVQSQWINNTDQGPHVTISSSRVLPMHWIGVT